jgi:PTH1 family peptidyl-tRNA hydrolase
VSLLRRRDGVERQRRGEPAALLVVGLGNPGAEYARSRHNVGAEVVEVLADRHGGWLRRSKEQALVAEVRVDGQRVALAFPQTYVNESGRAVQLLVRRHGIDEPGKLLVVHDELDLPPGALRLKRGGGLAGHNGLRSIRDHLHTTDFLRARLGVGKPPSKERGADHVLSRVPKATRELFDVIVERAADAVELTVAEGFDAAMNVYNRVDPAD